MDRRQRKTRDAIFTAFSELLGERNYQHITVQDIIDRADVGRTTFYAHFETKDDLLRQMCEDIFGHVFSEHMSTETTHDFSGTTDISSRLTHILYHLRDEKRRMKHLMTGESAELFTGYLKRSLYEIFEHYDDIRTLGVPKDYILEHMTGDFAETVKWWMNHEEYSPEDICRFYMTTTPFLVNGFGAKNK